METNNCRVYFALGGDNFEPKEVTKLLGVTPTSVRRKGEKILGGRVLKHSTWELSTNVAINDYIDVFEMAKQIVDCLLPKKALILEAIDCFDLSPRFIVVLMIAVDETISTPAIGFDAETIRFLGEIGAYIDIDTYKH